MQTHDSAQFTRYFNKSVRRIWTDILRCRNMHQLLWTFRFIFRFNDDIDHHPEFSSSLFKNQAELRLLRTRCAHWRGKISHFVLHRATHWGSTSKIDAGCGYMAYWCHFDYRIRHTRSSGIESMFWLLRSSSTINTIWRDFAGATGGYDILWLIYVWILEYAKMKSL